MSRQASPTTIGVFVLGALLLLLVGIVVFGSGKFFADTIKAVMYFKAISTDWTPARRSLMKGCLLVQSLISEWCLIHKIYRRAPQ